MKIACDHFSKPSATGDAMKRDRRIGHSHNLSSVSHMFLLFVCMEWIGVLDNMQKSFQRPGMTISQVGPIAERTLEVSQRSREDDCWINVLSHTCSAQKCTNALTNPLFTVCPVVGNAEITGNCKITFFWMECNRLLNHCLAR